MPTLGNLIRQQQDAGILKEYTYKTVEMPWWASFVPYLIVLILFGLLWYFMMNKQNGERRQSHAVWPRAHQDGKRQSSAALTRKRSPLPMWRAQTRKRPSCRRS